MLMLFGGPGLVKCSWEKEVLRSTLLPSGIDVLAHCNGSETFLNFDHPFPEIQIFMQRKISKGAFHRHLEPRN